MAAAELVFIVLWGAVMLRGAFTQTEPEGTEND